MASSDGHRSGLLTASGVLSIVGGISQTVCSGLLIVDYVVSFPHYERLIHALLLPGLPDAWAQRALWSGVLIPLFGNFVPRRWVAIGVCLGVLGIMAVVGGVSAIRRRDFGLSLTGAICALPSVFVGIMTVVFVAMGKREFGKGSLDSI
jgi:hypothetical protein